MMTNCISCNREISGADVFGALGAEKCLSCWLSEGDWGHEHTEEHDPRLGNLSRNAEALVGTVKDCPRCGGRGAIPHYKEPEKTRDCYRCEGGRESHWADLLRLRWVWREGASLRL